MTTVCAACGSELVAHLIKTKDGYMLSCGPCASKRSERAEEKQGEGSEKIRQDWPRF